MGTLSYGLAAAVYAVLTLLLLPVRSHRHTRWFIAACAVTALWAVVFAFGVDPAGRGGFLPVYFLELLHHGAWLVALLVLGSTAVTTGLKRFTGWVWGTVFAGGLALPLLNAAQIPVEAPMAILSRSGLIMSLLGLVLLEQLYRNSALHVRRQLTYVVFGIGGIFVYDLFLYSQAELLRGLDRDAWNVRGFVNAALAPLIVLAVRRHPGVSIEVFVSRQAVFYSGAMLTVGVYLLLMAVGGYYVREIGGDWGRTAEIVFLTGAFLMLSLLVFSEQLRRHVKVFIHKHFFRNKYDYRLEWLRFIRTLSSTEEGPGGNTVGRTSLQAVAQILAGPGGVLFTPDDSGKCYVPVAAWPMRLEEAAWARELAASSDLVEFLAHRQWVIDLREYRDKPSHYGDLHLPPWMAAVPGLRIAMPLLHLKRLAGIMLLYDPPPPFELTYEDRDLLKTVGRHIATQLTQQEADRKLAESRQFEAYNRLTAFMMHDLKNSAAQLKLLVDNAERHRRNPEFIDDAILTIANTEERIGRLIEQLRGKGIEATVRSVDLQELVDRAVQRCNGRKPLPDCAGRGRVAQETPKLTVQADPEKLATAIEHVIRNAQDATPETGSIAVRLQAQGDAAVLEVTDTGCGMPQQFVRERLFKPFDSTKGSKGMGIGAYQVREYVRALGGEVEVLSTPGLGTRFSIRLPLTHG